MSYSRWGSRGSGHWYTYWCVQDESTENRETAIFDVYSVCSFTAGELRNDMDSCMAKAKELSPDGDTDELLIYANEFLADINESHPEI